MANPFIQTLQYLETLLSDYYRFAVTSNIADHIVSSEELHLMGDKQQGSTPKRASIIVDTRLAEEQGDIFIGAHFEADLVERINMTSPLDNLNVESIDQINVLIEEISHFHLIVNRATQERMVYELELELQAEIDKVIFTSQLLHKTYSYRFSDQLLGLNFRQSIIANDNPAAQTYEKASYFALQFCQTLLGKKGQAMSADTVRQMLCDFYTLPYHEKIKSISGRMVAA